MSASKHIFHPEGHKIELIPVWKVKSHVVASWRAHVINNLPQLFRSWNLYTGDSRKEWKGAMQAALRPTDNAMPRSEGEMIYSCLKLEYQVWKECQTLITTIIHLSPLALVSDFKSQFVKDLSLAFQSPNLSVSLEKQTRKETPTFQSSWGNDGFSVIISF